MNSKTIVELDEADMGEMLVNHLISKNMLLHDDNGEYAFDVNWIVEEFGDHDRGTYSQRVTGVEVIFHKK